MQDIVYLKMDYDSFVILCESAKIVSQSLKPLIYSICFLILTQPLNFFAPEIKKFIKEKLHKNKPFLGLHK